MHVPYCGVPESVELVGFVTVRHEKLFIYIRLNTPFDVAYQEYIGFADLLVAARLSESSIFNDE